MLPRIKIFLEVFHGELTVLRPVAQPVTTLHHKRRRRQNAVTIADARCKSRQQ
jgi:hypothetical protein